MGVVACIPYVPLGFPLGVPWVALDFFWVFFFGYRLFLGEVIGIFALNIPLSKPCIEIKYNYYI